MVQISQFMEHTHGQKFLDGGLGETVDVHGITAHKQRQGFNLFGKTFRVLAEKYFGIIFMMDHGRMTADRTGIRDRQLSAAGEIFRYLRNDYIHGSCRRCQALTGVQY